MFSVDTRVLSSKGKGVCSIQSDMGILWQWVCQTIDLVSLEIKAKQLHSNTVTPVNFCFYFKKLPYSNACNCLSVSKTLDKTLCFRQHIEFAKKLNAFRGLIYRVRQMIPKNVC